MKSKNETFDSTEAFEKGSNGTTFKSWYFEIFLNN